MSERVRPERRDER